MPLSAASTSSAFSRSPSSRGRRCGRRWSPWPGQDLVDALVEIGLDIAVNAGIAVDHLLNGSDRLVVVDVGIDADPVLGEVDADHSSADQAWPMWEPKLRTPGIARSSLLA